MLFLQVSSPLPKVPTAQSRETGRCTLLIDYAFSDFLIVSLLSWFLTSCFVGNRNDINVKGRATDVLALPSPTDKTDGTVALVKSGGEKVKTTPAGEYLTSALNEFDPDQFDSLAAISDGANKLLMLVGLRIDFFF